MKSNIILSLLTLLLVSPATAQDLRQAWQAGERALAAVVDHTGGFVNRRLVTLPSSVYTQSIEIVMPDNCPGYEVSDLGIVTAAGTQFLSEQSFQSGIIRYQLPRPAPIRRLEISLLAPSNEPCQLPIYVRPLPAVRL